MPVQRLAMISVHASPLATMGGSKIGGLNVYIRNLAQELGQRGIQVDIFTRRTTGDTPYIVSDLGPNVRVIYVTAGMICSVGPDDIFPLLPEFAAGVIAFATRQNTVYDLVYSHYWLSGWVANKLREIWGTPFVHMFHTLGHMKNRIVAAAGDISSNQRIRIETEITEWADRIIAATPAEYAQLRWLYRANRRKIVIISPGVDVQKFHPMSQGEARRQIGFSEEKRILLSVGRIEPLKAIDTVIRALASIGSSQPGMIEDLRYVVVGGNLSSPVEHEMLRLKALVKELNLSDYVHFVGAMDQSRLALYYAAASVVIMPSDYESFGMVALEAMASGTPVIASAVGGLAYLVKDGDTGYLVPSREPEVLAETIVRFLQLSSLQQQAMRKAALALAGRYTWVEVANSLVRLFEELLVNGEASHHKS